MGLIIRFLFLLSRVWEQILIMLFWICDRPLLASFHAREVCARDATLAPLART